jgi:hypothetical protein
MLGFIVLYVSSRAVMNDRGGTRLTGEESLQAVVDVVPGVIGLGGNSHRQDESHHRRQANARRIAWFKSHHHNSSSVLGRTLNKTIHIVSRKVDFFCRRRHRTEVTEATEGVDFAGRSFHWPAVCSPSAMAIGGDPGVGPIALRLAPTVERPEPYFFHRSRPAT